MVVADKPQTSLQLRQIAQANPALSTSHIARIGDFRLLAK
jgi:hypothetical protein